MGEFNQRHQQVKRDQYNAEGNIYQYRDHYLTKVDTSGFKFIGRSMVIGSLLGFLLIAGLVGGGVWFVSTGHLKIPALGSVPSSSLNQMLYGTPPEALKQFCNGLMSNDLQGAYDVYSSHLKSQISLDQFTNTWTNNIPEHCTSNITTSSNTSASGTIHTTRTTLATDGRGFVTNSADYKVTLVTNNGIWQIDEWQQGS